MGIKLFTRLTFPKAGVFPNRFIRFRSKEEMTIILFSSRKESLPKTFLICWSHRSVYTFPQFPLIPRVLQIVKQESTHYIGGCCLASSVLILQHTAVVKSPIYHTPNSGGHDITESQSSPSTKIQLHYISWLGWYLDVLNKQSSSWVQNVFQGRKLSTRITYTAKWKWFSLWAISKDYIPYQCSIPVILDYLFLKHPRVFIASVKVHLAVISCSRFVLTPMLFQASSLTNHTHM